MSAWVPALKHSFENPWVPDCQHRKTQRQKSLYLPVPECQHWNTPLKPLECQNARTEKLKCQHGNMQVPPLKHSSAKHRNIQVSALQRNPQNLWAHKHIIVAQPFIKIKQKPLFTSKSVTRSAVYPTYARYVVHPRVPDRSFRKILQCLP